MYKIKYDIELNDSYRPCIELPPDNETNVEDKFFAIEISRYFLEKSKENTKHLISESAIKSLEDASDILGQVSDEMAHILFDEMLSTGELMMRLDDKYPFNVDSLEELELLGDYTKVGERIYKKKNGLQVTVTGKSGTYEYNDGEWSVIDAKE
jgi:hypothetical protein